MLTDVCTALSMLVCVMSDVTAIQVSQLFVNLVIIVDSSTLLLT